MRSIYSKSIVWALCLTGWVALVDRSAAQPAPTILVPMNVTWRYLLTNANGPAATWTATNYVDSFWRTGQALFGYEPDAGVYAPYTFLTAVPAPPAGGPNTIYFRVHFNYPSNSVEGVTFTFSNLLDDGAVFYMNGVEVQRVRIAAGAVTYATYAANQPSEGAWDVFTLVGAASNVRRGDNVLAIEHHNTSATSTDTTFGMGLSATWPTKLIITQQPASQVVSEGQAASFTVGVEGPSPVYSWWTNNAAGQMVRVFGVTAPTYNIANPALGRSGLTVRAVVTNILGAVTSAPAVMTVVRDIYGPGLVSAIPQDICNAFGCSNQVKVTFTENLLAVTATNRANYVITRSGTTRTVTVSNVLHSGREVTLVVGGTNWSWASTNYVLTVTNVADSKSNYISGVSNRIYLTFPKLVFPYNSGWWCFDNIGAYLQGKTIDRTNWNQPSYTGTNDTSVWGWGLGVIFSDNITQPPQCSGWNLGFSFAAIPDDREYGTTFYFRSEFVAPTNTGSGTLNLRYALDAGAVFYLNGVEIHRVNMPSGKVYYFTTATTDAGAPVCYNVSGIQVTNLISGTNLLAVEVHQSLDTANLDLYFGLEVEAMVQQPSFGSVPWLTVIPTNNVSSRTVRVNWGPVNKFPGWGLYYATNPLARGAGATGWNLISTNPPYVTNNVPLRSQGYYILKGTNMIP